MIDSEEEYLMMINGERRSFTHSWDTIEDALMLQDIGNMPKLVDEEYYVKITVLQGLDEWDSNLYNYSVEKFE